MDKVISYLTKEYKKLEKIVCYLEEQNAHTMKGSLGIKMIRGMPRYYHYVPKQKEKGTREIYLPQEEHEKARLLAQQSYDRAALRIAKKQLQAIGYMLKNYEKFGLENIYTRLSAARKALVTPVVEDPDEYAFKWENVEYEPGEFDENTPLILSKRRERVRSKTEKIIADTYLDFQIPYRYEYPYKLTENGREVIKRPDFTTLNRRTKKIFIHEHLGMMDDPAYAERNIRKIELYEQNGFYPGENLILTFETKKKPLDMDLFHEMINRYLK